MKKNFFTALVFIFVSATMLGQTIRRVNNNPGIAGVGIYDTPQAAHDAATGGDIISIEPSLFIYPGLIVTKPLTIQGGGFNLAVSSQAQSRIESVTLSAGSNGTTVTGLRIINFLDVKESGITIERVFVQAYVTIYTGAANRSNLSFTSCYFDSYVFAGCDNSCTLNTWTNISIFNCYLDNGVQLGNTYSAILQNNIIYNVLDVYNSVIANNITPPFDASVNFTLRNNTLSNNIAYNSTYGSADGNLSNVDMGDVFVVDPDPYAAAPEGFTEETRWMLKPNSPAIGAGAGGVDCGIYGGPTPYRPGGIPSVPTIDKFTTTGAGSTVTPLGVTISTKSNN
jgi:hypothetical protein